MLTDWLKSRGPSSASLSAPVLHMPSTETPVILEAGELKWKKCVQWKWGAGFSITMLLREV